MSKLFCTLARHVITDEGDFVPAGTPVQVLCWSTEDSEDDRHKWTVTVRATAYLYCDTVPDDMVGWDGNVLTTTGLIISVQPDMLIYHHQSL